MRRGVYRSSRANFFMEGKTETSTDWKVGCGTGKRSVDRIVRLIFGSVDWLSSQGFVGDQSLPRL
jgi:hypothetical protein